MKVVGRIILGNSVLIVLLVVLFFCQILVLRQMRAANRRNSGVNFRIAFAALQLMRDRNTVEECTIKYFSKPDPERKDQLKEARETFENGLASLQSQALSEKEQAEIARLRLFWREFADHSERPQPAVKKPGRQLQLVEAPLDIELEGQLERLRAQAYSLYQASMETLSAEAESSRKEGEKAELVLWSCAASSLLLGLLVSGFIVRSISAPLHNLAEGTRALAGGKEFYRLDTSRNDELSQIARDINTITRQLRPDHPTEDGRSRTI